MKKRSDLTIIMPIYNHAQYLTTAVESILKQTYLPLRLILIDDASLDDSAQIASDYALAHEFIDFFQNASQVGPNKIFNQHLARVMTKYVFFMSADDIIYSTLFETAFALLDQNPSAGVFSALSKTINEEGQLTGYYYSPIVKLTASYLSVNDCKKLYHSDGNWILGCTRIFRTKALKQAEFFEDLHSFADTYLAMTVALRFGACFSPHYLSDYRISKRSYSLGVMNNEALLKNIMQQAREKFLLNQVLNEKEATIWEKRFMISALLSLLSYNTSFNLAKLKDFIPKKFCLSKAIIIMLYPVLQLRIHIINAILLYSLFKPRDLFQRVYRYLFYTPRQ